MAKTTALKRVRGLGSAHEGVSHWWNQKLTAGSNFLLLAWLLISLATRASYGYAAMREWLASPWAAVPMVLLIVSVFYHFRLGLQVVIEDYVHAPATKIAAVFANNFYAVVVAVACLYAILRVSFGQPPV